MLGTSQRPLRVAIIGAGPSGFYAAETLLGGSATAEVEMFDYLPAPFGLVRYGVAPDHPKIKNVIKIYEKVAAHPKFFFLGNVKVGRQLSVEELRRFYDVVIFTCGAQTDRKMGIPGEELPGSHTAIEFVAWYNGHPDYAQRQFDLSQEIAVVIGQGNVAMDVSRILSKSTDELRKTDMAAHALEALSQSKVKEVHVIGRRGPVQAAFTSPEIKEVGELSDCDVRVSPDDLVLNPESQKELEDPNFSLRRKNFEILTNLSQRPLTGKPKRFILRFYESPVEIKGRGKVEELVLEKNILVGQPGSQQAKGTGEVSSLFCGLIFRSVRYRGVPIDGIPFDEKKGIFVNREGRIDLNGKPCSGFYCSGWIKRGPSGVIGTNKSDSDATVQKVWQDLPQLNPCPEPSRNALLDLLKNRGVRVVSFSDWKKIDAAEIARGEKIGKPREKFVNINEMLAVLGKN